MPSLRTDDVNNSFLPKKKNVTKIRFSTIRFTMNKQNSLRIRKIINEYKRLRLMMIKILICIKRFANFAGFLRNAKHFIVLSYRFFFQIMGESP